MISSRLFVDRACRGRGRTSSWYRSWPRSRCGSLPLAVPTLNLPACRGRLGGLREKLGEGSTASGRGVAHEDLRDRLAPRSAGAFAAFEQIGRGVGVEDVGVGPVLVHAAPRIGPVIEQLAADQMAADAPHVLIALSLEMLVADHHVVDVGGLVGEMVEAALVAADAEECVMIDIILAAVQAIERADDVALLAGIELVRAAEA